MPPQPKPAKGSITLIKVAERAGVSVMTASRALNGEAYVSEKTRERVLTAAAQLSYAPNLSARVMRGGRSNVVGVLVSDLNTSVVNAITTEVTALVRKAGMDLLIYNAVEHLRSGNSGVDVLKGVCDGLLLVLPRIQEGQIAALEQSRVPIVLLNYWREDTSLPVVRADNYFGAREAVRHLLRLGHARIGFIAGGAQTGQSGERQRGYSAALAEFGIETDAALIAAGDFSQRCGLEGARRLLSLPDRPTAIFAANDDMAFGVMDAARAMGLRLPEELSVVGFDDIGAAEHVHPALTTIRQPLLRLAEAAVQELLSRIGGQGAQHSTIELPSELVIRASTAPPAARAAKRGATSLPRA